MQFRLESKKNILKGFFNVEEQHFVNENTGERFQRLCVVPKEAAAILLHLEDEGKIVLGRQYRTPFAGTQTNPYFLEIPAGVIDEGESAKQSIIRESKEETGFSVDNPELIQTIHTSPGYTSEKLHIYYGKICREDKWGKGGGKDQHEEIEILELPLQEVFRMLEKGEITDAKTLIALYWLKDKLS